MTTNNHIPIIFIALLTSQACAGKQGGAPSEPQLSEDEKLSEKTERSVSVERPPQQENTQCPPPGSLEPIEEKQHDPAKRAGITGTVPQGATTSSFRLDEGEETESRSGILDPVVIRDVVRSHIDDVTSCYDHGLQKCENIEGRVELNFVIDTSGKVETSMIRSSTLNFRSVEKCIVEASKNWIFPPPRGGNVVVTYPFRLTLNER